MSGRLVTVTVTNVGDALGVGHALAYRLIERRVLDAHLARNKPSVRAGFEVPHQRPSTAPCSAKPFIDAAQFPGRRRRRRAMTARAQARSSGRSTPSCLRQCRMGAAVPAAVGDVPRTGSYH